MARTRTTKKQTEGGEEPVIASKEGLNPVEAGTAPPPKRKQFFSGVPAGLRKVEDALPRVTSVRTIFLDLNRKIRVAGLPVARMHTVHGPTHGGKSIYVIGLMASFLAGGHVVLYVDAEHSTPIELVRKLIMQVLGVRLEELPGFLGERPKSYEEVIALVDKFLAWVREQRKEHPELRALVVVDSINKLVPESELANLLKVMKGDGKASDAKAINKVGGRGRAQLNALWLDHIIPLLEDPQCAFVPIAREGEEDEEEAMFDMMESFQVKGGKSMKYDASCLFRILKVKAVKEGGKDAPKDAPVLAWEHRIRIWKSKVGQMDGRHTDCTFYLKLDGSFDLARDAIHVGNEMGILKGTGWMEYKGVRKNGTEQWHKYLEANPKVLRQLQDDICDAIDKERVAREKEEGLT